MIQLLIFHHKERRLAFRIHPRYKKGGIIEVYAKHAKIDNINNRSTHFRVWSHLRIITVENILYVHGAKYRHRRILLKELPKENRKELRRTGKIIIKEDVFYQSLEGEK